MRLRFRNIGLIFYFAVLAVWLIYTFVHLFYSYPEGSVVIHIYIELTFFFAANTFFLFYLYKRAKSDRLKWRRTFDGSSSMMLLVDENRNLIKLNKAALDVSGKTEKDAINSRGGEFFNCVFANDHELGCGFGEHCKTCFVRNAVDKTFLTQKNVAKTETTMQVVRDGDIVEMNLFVSCVYLPENKTEVVLLILDDITPVKITEKLLFSTQKRYEYLVENSPYVLYRYDAETGGVYFSSKVEDLLGYTVEHMHAHPTLWTDSIYLHDRHIVNEAVEQYYQGQNFEIEYRLQTKSGKWIWVRDRNVGLLPAEGSIQGIAMDITERKETELRVASSETKFRTVFESSHDSLFILDIHGEILEINDKALGFLNMNRKDAIGSNISKSGFNNQYDFSEFMKNSLKNATFEDDFELTSETGQLNFVEISGKRIIYADTAAVLVNLRESTQKKELQKEIFMKIIETEEKERNRFAQELHDGIGPLLSTIKLYTQWLAKPDAKSDKTVLIEKSEETIDEAIKSLRDISNNLSPHVLQNFGLISAIQSFSERILENKNITFYFEHKLKSRLSQHIETTVYRILTECINNTVKYADAGKIELLVIHFHNLLSIKYKDDGKGFDIEKVMNEKTGMGLFNIRSRLNTIRGKLKIASKEGKGTLIAIEIKTDFNTK